MYQGKLLNPIVTSTLLLTEKITSTCPEKSPGTDTFSQNIRILATDRAQRYCARTEAAWSGEVFSHTGNTRTGAWSSKARTSARVG